MKTFRILSTLALVAVTVFQTYCSARYHRLADSAKAQAVAIGKQADILNHQVDRYNSLAASLTNQVEEYKSLPKPYAELCVKGLHDTGFTNVQCLVFGERYGKTTGFLIESNKITEYPYMEMRMLEIKPDEMGARKKL